MPPQHTDPNTETLTDIARDILDFEKLRWIYPAAKESAIRTRFGLTATRYYQHLNTLIDHPAAEAHDPQLVRRLRRLRDERARQRTALRAQLVEEAR